MSLRAFYFLVMFKFIDRLKYKALIAIGLLSINYILGFLIVLIFKPENYTYDYSVASEGFSWVLYAFSFISFIAYLMAGMVAAHRKPTVFSSGFLLFIFSLCIIGADWLISVLDYFKIAAFPYAVAVITNSVRFVFLTAFRDSAVHDMHIEVSIVCAISLFTVFICGFLIGLATRRKKIVFNFYDED